MSRDSLLGRDWSVFVARLGGAAALTESARETRAFLRPRGVRDAATLLRLVLAYCLGHRGLRLTAAWASAAGLADISNVAMLKRLRNSADWLALLVGQALSAGAPASSTGRLIRLVDATCVPKAGRRAKQNNQVWRIHSAFNLPAERFGHIELTDQRGGERCDRVPVIPGEIRIADRAYLQPNRIAAVLEAGADIVVRAGWRSAWQTKDGARLDLAALLRNSSARNTETIDQPIWLGRGASGGAALPLRLVAVRRPPASAEAARRQARRLAQREGYTPSADALDAAEWVLIVTSLAPQAHPTADVLALYRLRWRIELAFKRLKSGIGLRPPPGSAEASARTFVLAHLLAILLLEPIVDEFGDSPRWTLAAA